MTWIQGTFVMIAENISLGILSLPAVLAKVGLAGGIVAIIGLGLFSTYSGYVLWQFKMKYPHVCLTFTNSTAPYALCSLRVIY